MMTPREELIDKVAKALEDADRDLDHFDSVKLAQVAIDVVVPQIASALTSAMWGVQKR